jgi:hypothetical protein
MVLDPPDYHAAGGQIWVIIQVVMMKIWKQLGYDETLLNDDSLSGEEHIASPGVFGVIGEHKAANGIVPNRLNPSLQKSFDAPTVITGPEGGISIEAIELLPVFLW